MIPLARFASILLMCSFQASEMLAAQAAATHSGTQNTDLKFVVILSRHGVRSPTGKPVKYNPYSAAPWPHWDVPPGHLTAHGYQLMKLFGAYDRALLASDGLVAPTGCADAARITILADSDQRTRETGEAIAGGMFPGCSVEVHALPEGTNDPLFHPHRIADQDRALALAAVEGRIGEDPGNLTAAYRPELTALDSILAGCGHSQSADRSRTTIFDVPSSLAPGSGSHPAELHGPLTVASSLSENLLLEYAEGMTGADLGWGCLNEDSLRNVMQLHTAAADYTQRTPTIARMYASNLLDCIFKALEQHVSGKPVAGAPGKPSDHILFLVGHDTNITTVAGALGLDWIIDGRRDDTPPGGALVFELWRARDSGAYSVRVCYTAQTLRQMRETQALTLATPPVQVPIFVPGCSRQDMSCAWNAFADSIRDAIDPDYVSTKP
ncbi:MAG: histidine-type phosphatase [Terracidiphilus sp.]